MNLQSVPVEELRGFVELVLRLRAAQRAYFLGRERVTLERCKALEGLVDAALNDFLRLQPRLFDPHTDQEVP